MHTHAGSQKERCVHIGKLSFGPWYLVHGILVLVHGIWSEVLTPGIGSRYWFNMVLDHGIERSLNLYKEKIIRQRGASVQGLNI